jgi:hypothetical protein
LVLITFVFTASKKISNDRTKDCPYKSLRGIYNVFVPLRDREKGNAKKKGKRKYNDHVSQYTARIPKNWKRFHKGFIF